MTYASHARVITGIIQANLIHLSIKMTTPHQSGAPFVGERVFQNRGVCGQAFPSFPSPTPFLQPFCSRPIFRASPMRKTNTRCPNSIRFVRESLLRRLGEPLPAKRMRPYPHAIFYDFEAYQDKSQRQQPKADLAYENVHVLISVSLGDMLDKTPTHLCDSDPKRLVRRFIEELERRGAKILAREG